MVSDFEQQGDWDFRGEDTKEYTHCFHIYPAMMIPQIARRLIQKYGKEDGMLFDPYCGSGTSLVEARVFGMDAAGTDLNPTARLIAEAKTRDYDLARLSSEVERFVDGLEDELTTIDGFDTFEEPEMVTFARLADWFPAKTIGEICLCIRRIEEISDDSTKDFLRIALSECLRLTSFQRNGEFKLYRIPPDQRDSHYVALFPLLSQRINRNLKGCEAFCKDVVAATSARVHSFNTVEKTGLEDIGREPDLVVTSPPYGDSGTTVAYAQFSWLTNVWLGLDGSPSGALDRSLMGGRKEKLSEFGFEPMDEAIRNISEESPTRASEVMHFYSEYLQSIENVASTISEGGYACYVVGNRTVKGAQLPTDGFTRWAFEESGFTHEETFYRHIPNKRMPSRNSPSNVSGSTSPTMTGEIIVVMRKDQNGFNKRRQEALATLFDSIGDGQKIEDEDFKDLLTNHNSIPVEKKMLYRRSCIDWLRDNIGKELPKKKNIHTGDVIEQMLGLPSTNKSEVGDLLGLELKTLVIKDGEKSPSSLLSMASFPIVEELLKHCPDLNDTPEVVFFHQWAGHEGVEVGNRLLRSGEGFGYGQSSEYGLVKYDFFEDEIRFHYRRNEDEEWRLLNARKFSQQFSKFEEGMVLVFVKGGKGADRFQMLEVNEMPDFDPDYIFQCLSKSPEQVEGRGKREVYFEIRFRGADGNDPEKIPESTGSSFRMNWTPLKRRLPETSDYAQ